jgi:hypothetical protein
LLEPLPVSPGLVSLLPPELLPWSLGALVPLSWELLLPRDLGPLLLEPLPPLGSLVSLPPSELLLSLGGLVSLLPLELLPLELLPVSPDLVLPPSEPLPLPGLLLLALLGSGSDDRVLGNASGFKADCTAGSRSCTAGSRSCLAGSRGLLFDPIGSGPPKIALALKPSAPKAATRAIRPCHSGSLGIGHPPPPPPLPLPPLPLPCGPELPPPGPPKKMSRLCRVTAAPAQSPSDSLIRSASERFVRAMEGSSRHSAWVPDWCRDHACAALSPSSRAA